MNQFPKTLFGFYFNHGIKPYKFGFFAWVSLFVVSFIGWGIFLPLFSKWFVALFEKPVPAGETLLSASAHTLIIIFIVMAATVILNWLRYLFQEKYLYARIQISIYKVLYNYIYQQSLSFIKNHFTGKIVSQIEYISAGFQKIFTVLLRLLVYIVIILFMTGMLWEINYIIAIIIIIALAINAVWVAFTIRPADKISEKYAESCSNINGKFVDSISNYFGVKTFVGIKKEQSYMSASYYKRLHSSDMAYSKLRTLWVPPTAISYCILLVCVMTACIWLYQNGLIKVSEAVFALAVYSDLVDRTDIIIELLPDFISDYASVKQSYKELICPIEVADMPNAADLKVSRGTIELRNVSFKYKGNRPNTEKENKKSESFNYSKPVLKNLSLTIKSGEKVGLVGSSGAGKTTLMNLLMRFYDPINGEILIDGQDIKNVTQDSLRHNIAFIPQESTMFNRTIKENIGYGKENATDAEIKKAAKQAQADKFIMETEKKYNTLVGDRGIKLSGGQRQRVAIARAFLKDAPILILDEATSALDSETETAIQKSFEELSKGRTTIAIAHRLSTLRYMDRIVVMDKGKIAEQGTHAQLLRKKGGVYAKLWKMQSGGFLGE